MNAKKNNFIKNIQFTSSSNFIKCQQRLTNSISEVMNTYISYHTPDNYKRLDYTIAGLYIALKKVLPEGISFRIDYRIKATRSIQKTTEKEFLYNSSKKIAKDIFAAKVVITDIDGILNLDNNDKLIELQRKKVDNFKFIDENREWLCSDSTCTLKTEESYYKKMIELLTRLEASTYKECEFENEIPYNEKLHKVQRNYIRKKEDCNLSLLISKEQLSEMSMLLDDLENRLDDKFEHEILKVYLPKALESNLISNLLQTTYEYDKETINKKGYVADFYNITVGNVFKLELQSQSHFRYLCAEKGPAYHNGKVGKGININSFFELVDDNDSHPLEYYLEILGQMPIDTFEEGIMQNSKTDLVKKVETAYQHIKIKDTVNFNGRSYEMDNYLMKFAQYIVSSMSICRSAHNFNRPTVNLENKGLSVAFSDVLRKRDGITCLAQLLVDRVSSIDNLSTDKSSQYKQLTLTDIVEYAKTLPPKTLDSAIELEQ